MKYHILFKIDAQNHFSTGENIDAVDPASAYNAWLFNHIDDENKPIFMAIFDTTKFGVEQ